MATLLARKSKSGKVKQGRVLYTVQFALGNRRPCVPLGGVNKTQAGYLKGYIESLVASRRAGVAIDGRTADWLADLDDTFHARLVEAGLVEPRVTAASEPQPEFPRLGTVLDGYIAKRSDVKSATATVYGHTRRCLIEYFGADKPLREITPADADDWRRWLVRPVNKDNPSAGGQGLSDNTVRRRCGIAKQFFRDAVRRRLIEENPFAEMKGVTVQANRTRDYFVSREDADRILAACPDNQWRLLFALSRYGGLRCPSEHLALRWGDVDWERG